MSRAPTAPAWTVARAVAAYAKACRLAGHVLHRDELMNRHTNHVRYGLPSITTLERAAGLPTLRRLAHLPTPPVKRRRTYRGLPVTLPSCTSRGDIDVATLLGKATHSRNVHGRRGPPSDAILRKTMQAFRVGDTPTPDQLKAFRMVSEQVRWPGENYKRHRERMREACAAFDAAMTPPRFSQANTKRGRAKTRDRLGRPIAGRLRPMTVGHAA